MAGLPPIDERTMRATYERVLAAHPDELAQTDSAGSVTFTESYARAATCGRGRAPGARRDAAREGQGAQHHACGGPRVAG